MMTRMLLCTICCMLLSTGVKSKTDIQTDSFFNSLNNVKFVQDPYIPLLANTQSPITQSDLRSEPLQNDLDRVLAHISPAGRIGALPSKSYEWLHFADTNQVEALFESEFKVGFSKPLAQATNTVYQLGIAMIRPAVNSIAWNAPSHSLVDATDKRSSFVSFSIQSKF